MKTEYYSRSEIASKIIKIAGAITVPGIILGVALIVMGAMFIPNEELVLFAIPFATAAIGGGIAVILGSVAVGWMLKGFAIIIADLGNLTDKVNKIEESLTPGLAAAVRREQAYKAEAARREEAERARVAEEKRKAAEQIKQQLEKSRKEAEAAKQERINKYWEAHKEDYDELVQQREDAREALESPDELTEEEKKELEDFIEKIDRKLSMDRPE